MADVVKTEYMDRPTLGFSEFIVTDAAALATQSPKPGDRAIVLEEGKIYFCINTGEWLSFGGDE